VQNDFFDLPFGNTLMAKILPKIADYVKNWDGDIIVVKETRLTKELIEMGNGTIPDIKPYDETREYLNIGYPKHCIKWTHGWQIVSELMPALNEKNEKSCRFRTVEAYGQTWHDWANNIATYDQITVAGTKLEDQIVSTVYAIRAIRPDVPIKIPLSMCAGDSDQLFRNVCSILENAASLTWSLE
jgi:nicotinamidase-related amidase